MKLNPNEYQRRKKNNERQRKYRAANATITIPHEVVVNYLSGWTLLKAWRFYLKKTPRLVKTQILEQLTYSNNNPNRIKTTLSNEDIASVESWYYQMEKEGLDCWNVDYSGRKIMPLAIARFLAKILGIDYRQLRIV